MPGFGAEVSHTLGCDAATERLKGFADRLRQRYKDQIKNIEESWDEEGRLHFAFKSMGMKIKGTITIDDDGVKLEGSLPFAAIAFRGKIESEIRRQLEKALEPNADA